MVIPKVKRPPECVFCRLEKGELTIARAPNGKATALRVACPACGWPETVELIFEERSFLQPDPDTVLQCTPGWQCPMPNCAKQITITGGRFVFA